MLRCLPLILIASLLGAEEWIDRAPATNIVVPQGRVLHWHVHPPHPPHPRPIPSPTPAVTITQVEAAVAITGRVAVTTVDVRLHNPARRQQEAEVMLPVPAGVTVTGLDFQGAGGEPSARLLPREEARRIYRQIVSRLEDPALMEFIDTDCIRTSVFPVPAGGKQTVRLVYEQVLPAEGNRIDYVLPRSSHVGDGTPWRISAVLRSDQPVASLHSPSHPITKETRGDASIRIALKPGAEREPGSFRLSWLLGGDTMQASVVAYPDVAEGGGWFMLLAGSPELPQDQRPTIKRELSIVLDRSGSMNGDKIAQVREAARQIIAGLEAGERFNLFRYNHGVERFAAEPVVKDAESERAARAWIDGVLPRGGTNIHDALHAALSQPATDGMLPVVLFLTDGVATVGPTGEAEIRAMAEKHNPHGRRIFSLGVGADVNTHLLEKLADDSRATAGFVLPGEDIEVAAATTFERLRGPVLRDLELRVESGRRHRAHRVTDLSPSELGDLFAGEEILLLGRYTDGEPLNLLVSGRDARGEMVHVSAELDPAAASTVHGYVPRLWATRHIAQLVDAIRVLGMDGDPAAHRDDPRYRELVDEIVRLSTTYGVLTEYTAFLAEEGSVLAAGAVRDRAEAAMERGAFEDRSGGASLAQSRNGVWRKQAKTVNLGNRMLDADLQEVDAGATVQPQAAGSVYQRGGRWVEGKLMAEDRADGHDREVAFASDAYFALAERLAAEQRHAALALKGDLLIDVDGERILVRAP